MFILLLLLASLICILSVMTGGVEPEGFIAPSDVRTQKLKNILSYLRFTPTPGMLWTQENAQGLQVRRALLGSTDETDISAAQSALKSWGMFAGNADGVASDAYSQARTKWVASQSSESLDIIRSLVK